MKCAWIIRLLGMLALFMLCLPAWATISWLHTANTTSSATLTITSTTAGNTVVVGVSSQGATPSVTLSSPSQPMTQLGTCIKGTYSGGTYYECAFYVAQATGGQTTATCSGCTSFNFMAEGETSGAGTPFIDSYSGCTAYGGRCQVNSGGSVLGVTYNPGYSSEAVMMLGYCSGTCTTPTTYAGWSGTPTVSAPGGNFLAYGISSGTTQVSAASTSGAFAGFAIGITGSGATQQLTSNQNYQEYSTEVTSGTITLSANVAMAGDLVIVPVVCVSSCTVSTLTLNGSAMTCPAGVTGPSNSSTGQGRICYATASSGGTQNIVFTPGGSPASYQISYMDVSLSGNNSIAYDTGTYYDCVQSSTCTTGTNTVTLPSLTASGSGEYFVHFLLTQHHVTGYSGSWGCYEFVGASGDNSSCFPVSTVNGIAWISAAGSATEAANATMLDTNDPYQSIVAAFKYTSTSTGVKRLRGAVIGN